MLETMDVIDREKKILIHKVQQLTSKGITAPVEKINERIIDLIKQYREFKNLYV
jgi:hypothetical protein